MGEWSGSPGIVIIDISEKNKLNTKDADENFSEMITLNMESFEKLIKQINHGKVLQNDMIHRQRTTRCLGDMFQIRCGVAGWWRRFETILIFAFITVCWVFRFRNLYIRVLFTEQWPSMHQAIHSVPTTFYLTVLLRLNEMFFLFDVIDSQILSISSAPCHYRFSLLSTSHFLLGIAPFALSFTSFWVLTDDRNESSSSCW